MPEEIYTPIEAKIEAVRCLMCADAPCTCNCPAGVDARSFIRKIRFDNLEGAVRLLKRCNVLAASCAHICPTGVLCGKGCLAEGLSRPIDIGGLQKFVMEWERKTGMIEPKMPERDGAKIAVVGSGPAGLASAAELAVRGHIVTVFEKNAVFGGMLRHCIPSFRLPDEVIDFEIEFLKKLGIEFIGGHSVDDPKALLKKDFKAIFIATGLGRPQKPDIINSGVHGVHQALAFLSDARNGKITDLGKRAIVIGGGDTALDAARVAKRAGTEVFVLYRRTQGEMPAYRNEIDEAWSEGVEFYFRTIVRSVLGENQTKGVRCVRIRWHEKTRGTTQGYDVEGAEFTIACDSVIVATGQAPSSTFNLRETPGGLIAVDKDTFMTSENGIFSGGDVAFGGSQASRAIGQGRQAAIKIDEYVSKS